MTFHHIARTFAVVLGVASMTARAGSVHIGAMDLDEGNARALLESSSQHYVDAMRALIVERYKDEYHAIRWEALDTAMARKPVARMEYRYGVGPQEQVRVYHALGGEPLGTTARGIFEGPTRPGTPSTPSSPGSPGSSDVEDLDTSSEWGSDHVADDLADEAFFSGLDDVDVRALSLPQEGSMLHPFVVEGVDRALDAEFKALRTLERDIQAGTVPRGGRVVGFLSQATCASCRYAMNDFAKTYDIDISMTQFRESMTASRQAILIESGKARLRGLQLVGSDDGRPLLARDLLVEAREAQVRQSLSPRAMGRAFKGALWRQRSFRLGPPRLPRVSEGSVIDDLPAHPDVGAPSPSC